MKKFWEFRNAVASNGTELVIDGVVASETWWGDEVTPEEFRNELRKHSGDLTVVINSPGGDVFAGLSIYNALREHNGTITVRVDGLAASIASIIAMAGDHIAMSPGTQMMIHKPSVLVAGNADDLDKAKSVLEAIEDGMVPIYMARTGLSREKISEMLEAETWMSPEQAVELGFADEALAPVEKSEKPNPMESVQNLLGRSMAFSMSATRQSVASLIDKMRAQAEEPAEPEQSDEEAPAETEQPTEPAEPEAAAPEEAEPTEPEAETPDEEVEPEETEAIEPTEENETMGATTTQYEIAKDQVMAPNPAMVEGTPRAENYLNTKQALTDFANVLAEFADTDVAAVRDAWMNHLKVTMGVTNPEKVLPTPVADAIESAFKAGGKIWNRMHHTGLQAYATAWDTGTGRAQGHKAGTDKKELEITLQNRLIEPDFVYAYIQLDKIVIYKNRGTNAILKYVLQELPKRIINEIERAAIIGDGRGGSDDDKIKSFVSVKDDATANNIFAKTYTPASNQESKYDTLLNALDLIDVEGDVYLISKKGYATSMKLAKGTNGGYVFAPGVDVLAAIGIAENITPQWLNDTNDSDNDAYLVVLDAYKTVGENSVESYSNFLLKKNKNEYLQEIVSGGALSAGGVAAVAIKHVG